MTPQERQQKLETLRAVGALAPLVTALYDANETVALNTVTNSIREALAPMLTMTLVDDGAMQASPSTDSVGAGKSYTFPETDMDVVVTFNGQKATGKTVLAKKIVNLLRSEGFVVDLTETDGSVEILRVINPAERFRDAGRTKPQPKAEQATAKPTCDCTGCRLERGEAVSDADRAQYEKENQQFQRVMDMLTQGRIFGLRG